MKLVVDTNCLLSALIKSAKSREIICSPKVTLYAPEHIITESINDRGEISDKAGLAESEFDELISTLLANVAIVPESEFKQYKEQALTLVKHPEDAPFLALSMAKGIPLWSNDKELKQQTNVKVFSTGNLVKDFGL